MEEEKKELKQEPAAEDEKKIHKKTKRKFLLLIPALIVLGVGLYFVLRETGVINKYVYEEVENLAEREGVCFDNLLFSALIGVENRGGKCNNLCIFKTGDIYCFEWNEPFIWDVYYSDDVIGYDDTNWEKMQNVLYLGRFSDNITKQLCECINNFDFNSEVILAPDRELTVPNSNGENVSPNQGQNQWETYSVNIYWPNQPSVLIEWVHMKETWYGGYEKGEIEIRYNEKNALEAMKIFESSLFFDRWVKICLRDY